MSRSALWRQEANVKERERHANETLAKVIEEGKNNRAKGLIPLIGGDTFNLNPMLLQNISLSPYFINKCCGEINDWTALIDEIYYEVKHVEPWAAGPRSKLPSTAFCLLLRFFTLRCSERQMTLTLEHHDSPYIRCMGFLYLRYSCEPQYVWNWIRPYLYDQELVTVQNHGQEGTIGDFVRSLFGDLDYYGTRLPRLPVNIERDLKVKLLQAERNEERAKKHINTKGRIEYFKKLGSSVRALYEDDDNPLTWYDAVVDRVLTTDPDSGVAFVRPKFVVTFPEYGNTETVTLGEIDIPGGSDDGLTGFDNRGNPSRMERGHGRHRGDDRGHGTGGGGGGRQYDDRRQGYGREQALMEEVLRRERAEASTSNRRNYGTRPSTTKEMFSHTRDDRKRSSDLDRRSPPPPKRKRSPPPQQQQHQQFERSRPYQKTPEELAAIAEKKRKLMAKYG